MILSHIFRQMNRFHVTFVENSALLSACHHDLEKVSEILKGGKDVLICWFLSASLWMKKQYNKFAAILIWRQPSM